MGRDPRRVRAAAGRGLHGRAAGRAMQAVGWDAEWPRPVQPQERRSEARSIVKLSARKKLAAPIYWLGWRIIRLADRLDGNQPRKRK